MAPLEVGGAVQPKEDGGPLAAREALGQWLEAMARHGELDHDDPHGIAELLLGAAEAQAMLSWLYPNRCLQGPPDAWANRMVTAIFEGTPPPPMIRLEERS